MKAAGGLLVIVGGLVLISTVGAHSETILQQLYHQQTGHTGLLVAILGAVLGLWEKKS